MKECSQGLVIIAKCFNESDKFFGTYDFFLQIPEMPLLLVLLNILRRPLYILSSMNSWKKGMNMQLCSILGDAAQEPYHNLNPMNSQIVLKSMKKQLRF